MYKQNPIVVETFGDTHKTKIGYSFIIDDLVLDLGNQADIIRAIVTNFEVQLTRLLKERIERKE